MCWRGATKDTGAAGAIQVATIAGTIQVREWPAIGQRRGDAFLIHGLFADADSYTLLARRLAKGGLRVLAIDLPGHGGSEATGRRSTSWSIPRRRRCGRSRSVRCAWSGIPSAR